MRDLSLHLLDLTMNSIRAKATLIEIKFIESKKNDQLIMVIKDNG
ncbi:ATP-binding protein, partial [Turicibacter sanguinis]|nr:ATP-binding protein [Turicibacter sanguinis]